MSNNVALRLDEGTHLEAAGKLINKILRNGDGLWRTLFEGFGASFLQRAGRTPSQNQGRIKPQPDWDHRKTRSTSLLRETIILQQQRPEVNHLATTP